MSIADLGILGCRRKLPDLCALSMRIPYLNCLRWGIQDAGAGITGAGCEIWDVRFGMWDLGCGIWDVRFGM